MPGRQMGIVRPNQDLAPISQPQIVHAPVVEPPTASSQRARGYPMIEDVY